MSGAAFLDIDRLERVFGGGRTLFGRARPGVHAVREVTLDLRRGETLGIVGESGCGKSTLARMIVGLDRPTAGRITLDGRDLVAEARRDPRALARRIQYVFQDPVASLNPRRTIRAILEAPLRHLRGLDGAARGRRLADLMEAVNLAPEHLDRYPHEFSGGQAQRIGIARALAAEPDLIVLDEPVSALDVSVQAQVLNILDGLRERFGLTYVFISHDLAVIESVSDRVAVMYFGHLVEIGRVADVFARPRHPYTRLLLASVPAPGRAVAPPEEGEAELPDPYHPPPGCPFHARCPRRSDICLTAFPPRDSAPGRADHLSACYHPEGDD
ncbi:ABC transporter ATP-binding protein [Amaricoccus solimangrovi]|uniref:ATP-binding cassette domain-containing protein n=1 Tax=Amaricoccus solimangrovi TaxID=2589815 RepID=A0A501WZD6_9RHOB|nr:oligopeptide/dipeptide ABC transporter ATP-binding protein [Amaricoccus solimangrovi]TPE53097.1 ATP-binding cassette domain-containing protein [Amaricoccus solimangrovi]